MHQSVRHTLIGLGLLLGLRQAAQAQTTPGGVGIGTATPDASALLDITSGSKGLLAPRMGEAARTAIASPATGLLVYQTDGVQPGFWYYAGTAWTYLNPTGAGDNLGNHTATQPLVLNDNALRLRGAADGNHQLRFDLGVQGPQLFGYQGGELGYNFGSGYQPVLRWNNGGNVGIGTSMPSQRLEVLGNVQISGSGSGLKFPDGTTQTTASAGDNLGNHTATQPLVLDGNALRLRGAADGNHQLRFDLGVQGPQLFGYQGGELGYNFGSGYQPVLRWNNSGNVGIGTSAPTQKLEVAGNVKISGAGNVLVFADNTVQSTAAVTPAPQTLSINGQALTLTRGGTVTLPAGADNLGNHTATQNLNLGTNQLVGNGGTAGLSVGSTGNVGIGTSSPQARLDVAGDANVSGVLLVDANATNAGGIGGSTRQPGLVFGGSGSGEGLASARQSSATNPFGLDFYTNFTRRLSIGNTGNVGIGTATPGQKLEVAGSVKISGMGSGLVFADNTVQSTAATADNLGNHTATQALKLNNNLLSNNGTGGLRIDNSGNVGIGTSTPAFALDVQTTATPASYSYVYFSANGQNGLLGAATSTGAVSIRAAGRVLAAEFNATSDRRLKTVIGLSNSTADLNLLTRLRITDYTMRDKAQYGDRPFKKVIAQEVEEVFPQAVHQQAGFVPDVYALATAATAVGDSLLRLTLPVALATPAAAGQRLKLLGARGEVLGIVAQAAAGRTLLVRGAQALVGQPVFVFGLEHADVRSVDYEALAMLNVSATQALVRKVEALEKQNAALQAAAAGSRAEVQQLKAEASTQTAALAQRLQALEDRLGAQASAK